MKNPDEFYFGMKNSLLENGRHRKLAAAEAKEREAEIGHDAVKIMKSQDLGYVRMQATKDLKKVEKMQASLQFLGNDGQDQLVDGIKRKKHTIFVHNKTQAENFDVAEHFDTVPEMAGRSFNRIRRKDLIRMSRNIKEEENEEIEEGRKKIVTEKELKKQRKLQRKAAKVVSKARQTAYADMEARRKRIQQLRNAEAHLITEKIIASKGTKRKIKGAEDGKPAIYKFKRKRSK